jgi:hypothetical protein
MDDLICIEQRDLGFWVEKVDRGATSGTRMVDPNMLFRM